MKQQEVFKKIGGIIREINEQYEYLETTGGPFNDLELELMVANSHFLSDHIEILRKLNTQTINALPPALPPAPVAEEKAPLIEQPALIEPVIKILTPPAPPAEPRFFEPVMAEEPEYEPIAYIDETPDSHTIEFEIPRPAEDHTDHFPETEEAEVITDEPTPEPETIRHELTLEDIGEDWEEDEPDADDIEIPDPVNYKPQPKAEEPVFTAPAPVVEPEIIEEPESVKEPELQPEPVAEVPEAKPQPIAPQQHTQIQVPADQVITLNQRMSAQMATSRMSDHLTAQPISDLKSAISLNDKLMYIKDLFNGYGLAYSEAIDRLNRMQSFEEAESFLKSNYATKNHWDEKPATADKFYAVLQRRYV